MGRPLTGGSATSWLGPNRSIGQSCSTVRDGQNQNITIPLPAPKVNCICTVPRGDLKLVRVQITSLITMDYTLQHANVLRMPSQERAKA
jgi:hypothetical protein